MKTPMKSSLDDDIIVTHTMGGIMEFIKTGVYPDKLKIYSSKYDKTWRIRLKENNYTGSLSVNRKVVYNYSLSDNGFSMQEIKEEVPASEWIQIKVNEFLID